MPVFWNVDADVFCDVSGCKTRLSASGDTARECVNWIKQAGWLYRKDLDGNLIVRCPEHKTKAALDAAGGE